MVDFRFSIILFLVFLWIPNADAEPIDREILMEVQKALHARGYNPGPTDGVLGESTKVAIAAFKRDAGLPKFGWISENLVVALGIEWDQWRKIEGKVSAISFARRAVFSTSGLVGPAQVREKPGWVVEIRLESHPGIWFDFALDDILMQPTFEQMNGKPGSALIEFLEGQEVEFERFHSYTIKSGSPEGREYGYASRSLDLK